MKTKIFYSVKGSLRTTFNVLSVITWLFSAIACVAGLIIVFNNIGYWSGEDEIITGIILVAVAIVLFIQGFLLKALSNIMEYIMLRKGEMYSKYDIEEVSGVDNGSGDWEDVARESSRINNDR